MLPSRFEYHRPDSLEEALHAPRRARRRREGPRRRPEPDPADEAPVRGAGPPRRHQPARAWTRSRRPTVTSRSARSSATATSSVRTCSKARYPVMAAAAPLISDPIVRNLGTIGGSLAHADPAGDWGSVMLALRASVVAAEHARRTRAARSPSSSQDTFTTALEPDEILTEVRVPPPAGPSGGTYLKLERKVGDFATVAAAITSSLVGRHDRARRHRPHRGRAQEHPGRRTPRRASRAPNPARTRSPRRGGWRPRPPRRSRDVRGSAEYKRHVVDVYVRRGLARALEMARAA